MRKLFLQMMISLDGYIAGPNGELDWHRADEEFQEYANQTLRSIDGILPGKKVYEVFINYWPNVYEELETRRFKSGAMILTYTPHQES